MRAVSAAAMREMDARMVREGFAASSFALMQRAGAAAAQEILQAFPGPRRILILAGPGNNGGDGSVMASVLASGGCVVALRCPRAGSELKGDAAIAFSGIPPSVSVARDVSEEDISECDLIVDAMLGTGSAGVPREPIGSWIRRVNASGRPVVSIDIPSGLNADDGSVPGDAVRADLTVTFVLPKTGMLTGAGPSLCGRIRVCGLGFPESLTENAEPGPEVTGRNDAASFFGREPFNVYKNLRGHAGVIGGSRLYPGAPFLSGEAALRTGAGLVTVLIPEEAVPFFTVPKALMVRRLPSSGGAFSEHAAEIFGSQFSGFSAVAAGPGMGPSPENDFLLASVMERDIPLILDADGLNRTASSPDLLARLKSRPALRTVLTPHEGEMRRLLKAAGLEFSSVRTDTARRLAECTGAVVVFKGAGTAVASPEGECAVNLSGCSALATAGSGDVLTGIIAALAARNGDDLYAAARAGVFLHGLAGELCAPLPASGRGVIADDLIRRLPEAMRRISPFA